MMNYDAYARYIVMVVLCGYDGNIRCPCHHITSQHHNTSCSTQVSLPQAHNALVELTICLPATYPSHTMPSVSMHAPHMTDTARVALVNSLTNHFVPGMCVDVLCLGLYDMCCM